MRRDATFGLMTSFDQLIEMARTDPAHISLSDGADVRVVSAAMAAIKAGIAHVTLVGDEARIRDAVRAFGGDPRRVPVEDPAKSPRAATYAERYFDLFGDRGADETASEAAVRDPLGYSAMMVRMGDADGTLGGATHTSAKTVKAALRIIGPSERGNLVSSFFLMNLPAPRLGSTDLVAFADCAMVVAPEPDELAQIAVCTARSYESITAHMPKVAMLSFSTKGSADHERARTIALAASLAKRMDPTLVIEGELQFDAAFVEAVSIAKDPASKIRGGANVFIFPNLDAANIGYKIAQRIGNAEAIGPILQGLARPANDLSRGCSSDDVYKMIAITSLQAARARKDACAALPV